jgi:hypothetical protein
MRISPTGVGEVLLVPYYSAIEGDVTFVEACYQAFFGRTADDQGMLGWLGKLAEGQARSQVLSGFANSGEFVALARSCVIRP